MLSALPSCSIYADLPVFLYPSLVTGDCLRPGLISITNSKTLCILERTIRFETNIEVKSDSKELKYNPLHHAFKQISINCIILSLSALGIVESLSHSFIELLKAVDFDSKIQKAILSRIINIAIRCTYRICCCRNKPRTASEITWYMNIDLLSN